MLENMDGMYPEDLESYAEDLRLGREYAFGSIDSVNARVQRANILMEARATGPGPSEYNAR
jgi:hypothetical protein